MIERRAKVHEDIKRVKMEQIYSNMRYLQASAFQIVASCGFGKSTRIPAEMARNCGFVKFIIVEPRVFVARNNAGYVNSEIKVKSKSIVRGVSLDSVKAQPLKTIIYCTKGKLKQMLELFERDPRLTDELCLVFLDWHVRDGNYAIVITMAINLL